MLKLNWNLQLQKTFLEKPNAFGRQVLWSDEKKIELSVHIDKRYVWRRKGEAFKPKNTVPLSRMAVVSSCSETFFVPSGRGTM